MRRAVVLLVSVLVLAGCGDKALKTSEVKSSIVAQFKAQNIALHDVSCPGDIKAKAGAAIHCTALNPANTKLILDGRVNSVKDGKARFRVRIAGAVARGTIIAAAARQTLEAKVGQKAAGMTCPSEVPIPTKPSVTCELQTQDGKRYDATVSVDTQSNIDVEVARTPKG